MNWHKTHLLCDFYDEYLALRSFNFRLLHIKMFIISTGSTIRFKKIDIIMTHAQLNLL